MTSRLGFSPPAHESYGAWKAIRAGEVATFRKLMAETDSEFYDDDHGTNYAQARYLLYYLQERGLLVPYYQEFFRNRKQDPSGYGTLRAVLGQPEMGAFQRKWESLVLGLREAD